jgi:hypothetical protein
MAEAAKTQLSVHPLLANLTGSGAPAGSTVVLHGYVGPASRAGQVRLYSSLEDLSHYIEFDESCVLHTSPASESVAPNNGVSVWVKSSTPIRWTRDYKNAKSFWAQVATMIRLGVFAPPSSVG